MSLEPPVRHQPRGPSKKSRGLTRCPTVNDASSKRRVFVCCRSKRRAKLSSGYYIRYSFRNPCDIMLFSAVLFPCC